MSVKKDYEVNNTNIILKHWSIIGIKLDFINNITTVLFNLFESKQAKNNNKNYFIQQKLLLNGLFNTKELVQKELIDNFGFNADN